MPSHPLKKILLILAKICWKIGIKTFTYKTFPALSPFHMKTRTCLKYCVIDCSQVVNFEHISHLCSSVSIIDFEQVNASWVWSQYGIQYPFEMQQAEWIEPSRFDFENEKCSDFCWWHTLKFQIYLFRSSHPELFLRKGVLKVCSKFTGEHLCRSAILMKCLCFATLLISHFVMGVLL